MTAEAITPTLVPEKGRRPDVEKELTEKYHVKWRFREAVPLEDFNKGESLRNQARLEEPLDDATVAQYAEAIARGDDFPAVIAHRPTARSKLVMVDGNHRYGGYELAGQSTIPTYEIHRDTDRATVAMLTYAMNTRHGRPTSESERVQQAIYLIEAGASQTAAAAAVNLSLPVLKKAIAARKADQRADEVGLKRNEWEALHTTVRNRLLNISTDEGFFHAAQLAFQAKLTAPETFDLVQLLNSTKSSNRQMQMVKQQRDAYRDRIQAGAGGVLGTADRRAQSPRARVARALSFTLSIPEADDAILQGYPEADRKEASENARLASQKLAHIADILDPRKRR